MKSVQIFGLCKAENEQRVKVLFRRVGDEPAEIKSWLVGQTLSTSRKRKESLSAKRKGASWS